MAQQQREPPDPALVNVGNDFQAMANAQKHLFDSLQEISKSYVALKAENEKLKADLAKMTAPVPTPTARPSP